MGEVRHRLQVPLPDLIHDRGRRGTSKPAPPTTSSISATTRESVACRISASALRHRADWQLRLFVVRMAKL
ncbi:hypothetical protein, partial [Mesorhizobium sp. M7A.T.Ca.TU.009.02.1.1]|uniref:hypothetical protein n=1 Tax=Mesorhizobium sp. M7A.T.Ca.TU.009.02.1.1 TaxID=2496791 RepID=UPI0019D1C9F0